MRMLRVVGLATAIALAALGLSSSAARADVEWLGVNTGQAMRTGTATPTQFYDRLTGMGGNVLREDVGWNVIEPTNDGWAWGYLDAEINAAPPGVGVILMFLNSPNWARDPVENLLACPAGNAGSCRMPPAVTKLHEWQEFVRETVTRYAGRVTAVEVWNEPNYKNFWRPNGNEPARWAGLVQVTAEALAEVDPTIPVISGGLGAALVGTDSLVGMNQGPYLDAAYASNPNLPTYIDGIGIHPYPSQMAPDAPGNRFAGTLAEIRAVRDARDPGKALWATETGYFTAGNPAVTEAQQRDWLMQIYDELLAAPDVQTMIVHALFNPVWTNDAEEGSFGIVRETNEPKPAWTAFHDRLAP
jgi:hypothetical protein